MKPTSLETQRRREQLKQAYQTIGWQKKVDQMSEAQVTAIYLRFKAQGKIKER